MIEIRNSTPSDRNALFALWREAFGDTESYINNFFNTAYSDSHCRVLCVDKKVVSVLYVIDCVLNGEKIAYIYAVATLEAHRGQGLCRRLTEDTHAYLKALGYAGEILVPASDELFDFYGRLGYKTAGFADSFEATASHSPALLKKLSKEEYAALRLQLLPKNGVILGERGLALLDSLASFYTTNGTLTACELREGRLFVHELLGDKTKASDILAALGVKQGIFRTVGNTPFLMGYSLGAKIDNLYFPLAFD